MIKGTIAILLMLPVLAIGQDLVAIGETPQGAPTPPYKSFNYAVVRAQWLPPCVGNEPPCGSPAVSYELQLQHEDDAAEWVTYATTDTTYVEVNVSFFVPVRGRVRGLDDQGRHGPYSVPGAWYVADFGPCGTPEPMWWDVEPQLPSGKK